MALLNEYVIQDDSDMAYAELWNLPHHAALGNQVISGCGVTEQATPDLTVAVASGSVFVAGLVKNVTAGSVDLSTEQAALTTGQARYAYIYVDSAGAVQKLAGTAATAGQQYPPSFGSLPDDCVLLARILLTEGDSAINTADIKDLRFGVPGAIYTSGDIYLGSDSKKINIGAGQDLQLYHDGVNSLIYNKTGYLTLYNTSGSSIALYTRAAIRYYDIDDGNTLLMDFDTNARKMTVGAGADPVTFENYGSQYWKNTNVHASAQFYYSFTSSGLTYWRSYIAPRLSDDSNWDWGREFGFSRDEGYWYFDAGVMLGDHTAANSTKLLKGTAGVLKIQSPTGYVEIGSQNSTNLHIYTDRLYTTFNSHVRVNVPKNLGDTTYPWASLYLTTGIYGSTGSQYIDLSGSTVSLPVPLETANWSGYYHPISVDPANTLWTTTPTYFNFAANMFTEPTGDDYSKAMKRYFQFKFEVPNPSVGYSNVDGFGTWLVEWQYSLDGGTTWTTGGDSTVRTLNNDPIVFSSNSVTVQGNQISGDVKFRIKLTGTGTTSGDYINIGTVYARYYSKLKTI